MFLDDLTVAHETLERNREVLKAGLLDKCEESKHAIEELVENFKQSGPFTTKLTPTGM